MIEKFRGGVRFLMENSLILIMGAVVALTWANFDHESYHHIAHEIHFVVNDVLMALFFLLAGKEIREARLPGGALHKLKTALLPIFATIGGMVGPALIFFLGAKFLHPELTRGWAIPMATDIAFCYLVARFIFGKTHPAIAFLLLLAIADDAGGLVILAVFYPQGDMNLLAFFGLVAAAIGISLIMWKKFNVTRWPFYVLGPGILSWWGFHLGGIHPALALVPLAWCMPHAHADMGIWAPGESKQKDTLNRMEHWLKNPVELILGLFGFVNAGVVFGSIGVGTWLVFVGLLVGKPLGIVLMTKLGQALGLSLPEGMGNRDLVVMGFAAGIGFTVALFVSVVAFPGGSLQDSVKMGALFSFAVAPISIMLARMLRVGEMGRKDPEPAPAPVRSNA